MSSFDDQIQSRKTAKNGFIPPVASPQSIGRYEIIAPIASGGMGTVYAGRLVGLAGFERLVAIKVIHPHLASETEFINMFLDEARLAARIHHPNVVEILEVGQDQGRYFMVGELVLGQDLNRVVSAAQKAGYPIPRPVLTHMIAQIAKGLHQAHEMTDENDVPYQLVHRDVSTHNIVVSYQGYAKLIDFGVAWAKGRLAQTTNGGHKGKIGYMPKEQLLGEPIDRRADIFALGVVLYTILTGQHPFPYEQEGQQISKTLMGDFPPPRSINPEIEPELEQIIIKAMAADPNDRFSTAKELEFALVGYTAKQQVTDPTSVLANLMHALFQKEISHQQAALKARRQDVPNRGPTRQTPPAPQTFAMEKELETTDFSSRNPQRRFVFAAVPILVVLAIAIFFAPKIDTKQKTGGTPLTTQPSDLSEIPYTPVRPPQAESHISIRFLSLTDESVVYLDGKKQTPPIQVAPSDTPLTLRVTTPGYRDFETQVIPLSDQTIEVIQPAIKKDPRRKNTGHMKKTGSKRRRREPENSPPNPKPALEGWEENPFE